MSERETDPWLLSGLILAFAALITLVTGFWGYGLWDYGFPLPWKTGGCPLPPHIYVACFPFSYSLSFFLVDLLFYAVLGYAIGFRPFHKKPSESPGVKGVVLLSLGLIIFLFGVIDEILGLSPLFLELFPQLDESILAQGLAIVILGVILMRSGRKYLRRPEPNL